MTGNTFALQSSMQYGAHIATIDPWGDWSSRHGRGAQDLGIDRIVTIVTGEIWTMQKRGYAADRLVDLPNVSKFITARNTLPNVTRRILVTNGPDAAGTPISSRRRSWTALPPF